MSAQWSFEAKMQAVDSLQNGLAQWMRSVDASEVVIEVEALGGRASVRSHAQCERGSTEENAVPGPLVQEAAHLRAVMARPGGGAWTWARLGMSAPDYRLVSDFDYNRFPQFSDPVTHKDCATDLDCFPRDPSATPEWMSA